MILLTLTFLLNGSNTFFLYVSTVLQTMLTCGSHDRDTSIAESPTKPDDMFNLTVHEIVRLPPVANFPGFANWGGINSTNHQRARQAHSDAVQLAVMAIRAIGAGGPYETVFERYFWPGNKSTVISVFNAISGSEDVGNILFPTSSQIRLSDTPGRPGCLQPQTLAWLDYDGGSNTTLANPLHSPAYLNVCPTGAWHYLPDLSAIKCNLLGDHVSGRMFSLDAMLLHEWTHWDALQLCNYSTHIGDSAFGPVDAQLANLQKSGQDPTRNADSYKWFALEAFYTHRCAKSFLPPRSEELDGEFSQMGLGADPRAVPLPLRFMGLTEDADGE